MEKSVEIFRFLDSDVRPRGARSAQYFVVLSAQLRALVIETMRVITDFEFERGKWYAERSGRRYIARG